MAKPNYAFEKRQRDLAKKKKNEEKRLRKAAEKDRKSNLDTSTTPDATSEADKPAE